MTCIILEFQGNATSMQNLKKSVYQQWLVADLEEIACSSLPRELSLVQRITLNDSFALQVIFLLDIIIIIIRDGEKLNEKIFSLGE